MISRCCTSALAALALIAGLFCDTASAAKKDGNYFEDAPDCCETGVDILTMCRTFDLSTADAAIPNGVLKRATTASHAIYTDGTNWVSNGQFSALSFWSAGNGQALREDFSDWPTYRVELWFYPTSQCTGYLAAYSSRNKPMAQRTFTSSGETVPDTGALKGRIGYILATFDGDCGRLGKIGYFHNLDRIGQASALSVTPAPRRGLSFLLSHVRFWPVATNSTPSSRRAGPAGSSRPGSRQQAKANAVCLGPGQNDPKRTI